MLINKYYPADYSDSYTREIKTSKASTPEMFLDMAFSISNSPWWVKWLMWLRNKMVLVFGLNTDGRLIDMVREQDENEIIMWMDDKHLNFYVSLWCSPIVNSSQHLKITTVVKYNNRLGRIYFMIVRPFHKIIIKSILRRIANKLN